MPYTDISKTSTPWAVRCLGIDPGISGGGPCQKGLIYLTEQGYIRQMNQPNKT